MSYTILSHVYYQDKAKYEELYKQRVASESTCFLPIKIHDNDAFYCLCPEIYKLSAEIMAMDKQVALLCKKLPGAAVKQFTNKCLIDEIKLSNDIEHVYSTRKELTAVLDDLRTSKKGKRFYGLVMKYSMLNKEPFAVRSCADIRSIYDELVLSEVAADSSENIPDGTIFRKGMAEVTNSSQKVIHYGAYPENEIIRLMEQSLQILNDADTPILIRISLFHYLFGFIHPFYDGNGRTSRFISSYLLAQEFEPLIGYRISYTIKENLSQYYKAFQECNDKKNRGDLTPFIIMFLSVIRDSFRNLHAALRKRCDALEFCREMIKKLHTLTAEEKSFGDVLLQAALFSGKGITKKELADVLDISLSTVDKRLAQIRSAHLLIEHKEERPIQYQLDLTQLQNTQ